MRMLKPKKLVKGDLIGIISPASFPSDMSRIEKGVNYLERMGYRVVVGKNVGKERGYLAGDDTQRLEDLHTMFENKDVKAIINVRGGYGTGRLLDMIDYNLIKKNPKIFVGYSDITALQMAFLQKAGLVTFAGPMLAVDFWKEEVEQFTEEFFWEMVTNPKKIGKIHNPNDEKFYTLTKGRGEGIMIGGNMALVVSLLGTPYMPKFKDKILILEDIAEPPYRIDRMLYQMKYNGVFEQIQGLILGRFVDCYDSPDAKTLTLNEVLDDYLSDLKIPIIYNVKHGHISENLTIPFGLNTKMNAGREFIEITESAVEK